MEVRNQGVPMQFRGVSQTQAVPMQAVAADPFLRINDVTNRTAKLVEAARDATITMKTSSRDDFEGHLDILIIIMNNLKNTISEMRNVSMDEVKAKKSELQKTSQINTKAVALPTVGPRRGGGKKTKRNRRR